MCLILYLQQTFNLPFNATEHANTECTRLLGAVAGLSIAATAACPIAWSKFSSQLYLPRAWHIFAMGFENFDCELQAHFILTRP